MASKHKRGETWWVKFRFGGTQVFRSLKTGDQREAVRLVSQIERTLHDLETGRLILPEDADLYQFVLSDGRHAHRPTAPKKAITMSDLWAAYDANQYGQKERATQTTEAVHRGHLTRFYGDDKAIKSFTPGDITAYVASRANKVQPVTIKKEVDSLKMLLNRAERLVGEEPPQLAKLFRGVEYPKGAEPLPFLTWTEVEAAIARTKPDEAGQEALWDRVFLSTEQVGEFLGWAEGRKVGDGMGWFFPFLAAAAHTGMRRSELMRSQVGDWDLAAGVVTVRERKKSSKQTTYRRVTLTPWLKQVMAAWLDGPVHPGGQLAFCRSADTTLKENTVAKRWAAFTRLSKWSVLKGYHVFRHSFASNLARAGVDTRVIDELMGHQTEAMRKHYQHLQPDQRADAVARLFA